MITTSTPLRICLLGGSTDHPKFIKNYFKSHIISFTSRFNTYVTLSRDAYGFNTHQKKYLINYTKREVRDSIQEIKNDLVREVLLHFDMPPCSIYLTSDIYSYGSGLASSSSYLISLIKACCIFTKKVMSDYEIARLALKIERKFNPNTGFQDPFGCIYPGLKGIWTEDDEIYDVDYIPNKLNDYYNFDLIPTGVNRSSSKILNDLEKNIDKILPLYDLTLHARKLLEREEYKEFIKCISENWNIKKSTSKYITQNKKVRDLDEFCEKRDQILAHKLLGAGNGGFFLVVTRKNEPLTSNIFNVILRNA